MTRYKSTDESAPQKYLALAKEIKGRILTGDFPAGGRLPSKRTLADRYGVSLITVAHALTVLEEEGYLTLRERYGSFVRPAQQLPLPPAAATDAPAHLPEPTPAPDVHVPDSSVWFRTVRRVLSESGDLLLTRAPGMGCPVLRNALADYLARYRGMRADPACILIGSGAEQLYETVVKLLGRDRCYGIEQPSYGPIRAAYTGMGATVCPLPMGEDGIQSHALCEARFDVLHVTPFHSYPSGITTPAQKRREYLAWAAADPRRYVVEDDYASEFFRPGHPIPTLFASDTQECVLYLNTFSKSLSPAVRIGYLILPARLMPRCRQLLEAAACPVPVLDQYVLAAFLNSGDFERHLMRVRRRMLTPP